MKEKQPLQIGIIGLGAVGERLLRKFHEHRQTNVKALCDTNKELLLEFSKQLDQVATYTDYKEMLADPAIDLVYIAVPPTYHHAMAIDVLAARKHILCEKPLANSYEEAKEMWELAEQANVVHAIHFPLPYSNEVNTFIEKIKSGQIGKIKRVELSMHFSKWPREWQQNPWIGTREQGGFIREITPHYLQLILELIGDIESVTSFVEYPSNLEACETGVIARLQAKDGTVILIDGLSGIGQKDDIAFTFYGEKGVLTLRNWRQLEEQTLDKSRQLLEVESNDHHHLLVTSIVKAIEGKQAKIISFKEGFAVQEVLEKLLKN